MIQPSSVDVRVDRRFRVFHNARYPFIDVRQPMEELTEPVESLRRRPVHPPPRRVRARPDAGARRASPTTSSPGSRARARLGRLGPPDPLTAGFVDAGFEGNLTLELSNVANLPMTIYYGMPIGQISFMRMDGPVERPYGSGETGSKYQGQAEPTPSRFYLNFKR